MKKPILKGYYKDIFFEFIVHNGERDSIIVLPGFPSSNVMDKIIYFLYEKGFNVFAPRYKGTFQSKGKFLELNPIKDLIKFIIQLEKEKAISLWDMKPFYFKSKRFFVFGSSFGGSVACALTANSKKISKAVLFSPVWDYKKHNVFYKEQDLNQLTIFVRRAFQNLYRYDFNSIVKKIGGFKEFSPTYYIKNIKVPVLVFHNINDKSISIKHVRKISKDIKNLEVVETKAGHGLSIEILNKYFPQIEEFLKTT